MLTLSTERSQSPLKSTREVLVESILKDSEGIASLGSSSNTVNHRLEIIDYEEDLQDAELQKTLADFNLGQASQRLIKKIDHTESNIGEYKGIRLICT